MVMVHNAPGSSYKGAIDFERENANQKRRGGMMVVARKYRFLNYEDRKKIEQMIQEGKTVVRIAETLGTHRDTIYREFHRVGNTAKEYRAAVAQKTVKHHPKTIK